jgi:hypothetical protein
VASFGMAPPSQSKTRPAPQDHGREFAMTEPVPPPSPFYCLQCSRDSIADWDTGEDRYTCPHCERPAALSDTSQLRPQGG